MAGAQPAKGTIVPSTQPAAQRVRVEVDLDRSLLAQGEISLAHADASARIHAEALRKVCKGGGSAGPAP